MTNKIFLTLFAFFLLTKPLLAADLTVTCNNSECSTVPGGEAALFGEYEFPNYDIKPGDIIKRNITVKNENTESCNLYLVIKNTVRLLPHSLDEVLDTVIKDNTTSYYGGFDSISGAATSDKTLEKLYGDGVVYLGTIEPGSVSIFDWIVSINSNVGNEYQRAKTRFDFTTTFECGNPFNSPTPSPTSPPSSGKQSSLGINRPTCDNQNFELSYTAKNDGNPIKDVEVTFSYKGGNEVTKKTDENGYASAFFTYSGAGEVKAVASEGYSTLTDDIGTLICPAGIGGGLVLGIQETFKNVERLVAGAFDSFVDEATKTAGLTLGDSGQVKGDATACCPKVEPLWWIVLIMQTLVLVRFYMQRIKAVDKGQWFLMTLAVSILTMVIHWLGHPWFINRGYVESPYCDWLWLMAIINGLLLASVFRYVYKEEHEN